MNSDCAFFGTPDLCYLSTNSWFVYSMLQVFHLLPCNVCFEGRISHGGELLLLLNGLGWNTCCMHLFYQSCKMHAYHFSPGKILSQVQVIELSIGMDRILSLSLSIILSFLLNYLPSKSQLHCLEKNGRQTTRMISYCACHRYRVLIFYD